MTDVWVMRDWEGQGTMYGHCVCIVHGAGVRKREERVIYDEHLWMRGMAKYNCAMLVIYSREVSPECMVPTRGGETKGSPGG